jgi:hypothetical protein
VGSDRRPPDVTVIVPAWNAAATIRRCVTSVCTQAGVDLECIVSDDGSTDGTAVELAALGREFPTLRVLTQPTNRGVSEARNRALDIAAGRYLAFVDADDRLTDGALALLVRTADEQDAGAVIGQRVWTNGTRRWIGKTYDNPDIRRPGRKSLGRDTGLVYYVSMTGKLFEHALVRDLRFSGRVLGDQPWTLHALLRAGDRIVVVDRDVYEWWRPTDPTIITITGGKGRSIERALPVVERAAEAFVEIAADAETRIADPAEREHFISAYAERLIRVDVGDLVTTLTKARPSDLTPLFDAVGRFLAVLPRDSVARSAWIGGKIVRPPLRRWKALSGDERAAYRRMLAPYRAARRLPVGLAPLPGGLRGLTFVDDIVRGRIALTPKRIRRAGRALLRRVVPGGSGAAPAIGR